MSSIDYDTIPSSCQISGNGSIELPVGASGTGVIISEFYNGPGNDKAIELYNSSDLPVNLSTVGLTGFGLTPAVGTFGVPPTNYWLAPNIITGPLTVLM
ncbi:MAG: hypothetical protein IPH24_13675 [Crocinitomicaceae bacterium]|nr:hypothetical protein [Crocinitomicaceae bacterium]